MSAPKHTKEPWRYDWSTGPGGEAAIVDDEGNTIAHCFVTSWTNAGQLKRDVRRAVMCVNACAGVDDVLLSKHTANGGGYGHLMRLAKAQMERHNEEARKAQWLEAQLQHAIGAMRQAMSECADLISTPAGNRLEHCLRDLEG